MIQWLGYSIERGGGTWIVVDVSVERQWRWQSVNHGSKRLSFSQAFFLLSTFFLVGKNFSCGYGSGSFLIFSLV